MEGDRLKLRRKDGKRVLKILEIKVDFQDDLVIIVEMTFKGTSFLEKNPKSTIVFGSF